MYEMRAKVSGMENTEEKLRRIPEKARKRKDDNIYIYVFGYISDVRPY